MKAPSLVRSITGGPQLGLISLLMKLLQLEAAACSNVGNEGKLGINSLAISYQTQMFALPVQSSVGDQRGE